MKTLNATNVYALTLVLVLITLSFSNVATANSDPKRQYLVGAGLLCTPPLSIIFPSGCPDVASAANGDMVVVSGSGWFNPNPSGQARGGGSFVHTSSAGAILGFGTWTAEELISFVPGGFSTAGGLVPAGSEGGIAVLKVHILPATGGSGLTGIMTINCGLNTPGVSFGINLDVIGGPTFNTEVSGLTLFIEQ